jgi:hypothetical protein
VGDFFLEILEWMDFIRGGESSESSVSSWGVLWDNCASVEIFLPIRDFNFPFEGTGGSSSVSDSISFCHLLCFLSFVAVSSFNSAYRS